MLFLTDHMCEICQKSWYFLFKVPRNRSLLVRVNDMWQRGGERGEMARLLLYTVSNKLRALALTCYRFSSRAWYYIFLLNLISAKWRTRSQCDRINTRYWAMSIYKACPTSWMFRETVAWLSLKTCVQGGTLFPSISIYFAGKKSWKSVVKTEWDYSSALLT